MATRTTNPFLLFPTLEKALRERFGMRAHPSESGIDGPAWCMVRDHGCGGVHCRITSSGGPGIDLRFQVMDAGVIQSITALEFETRAELTKAVRECIARVDEAIG